MNDKYKMTLKEWLEYPIPIDEILYNSSLHQEDKKKFKLPDDGFIKEPIGVSLALSRNSLETMNNYINNKNINNILFFSAFRIGTDEIKRRKGHELTRVKFRDNLLKNGYITKGKHGSEYIKQLCQSKFTPSPEGNGIDCHRHWEALYCKCIPIVEDNELIKPKLQNLPVLYTKDYTEINDDYLNTVYNSMLNNVYDFSALFLSSYSEESQKNIIKRSRYWCGTRNKPQFYINE